MSLYRIKLRTKKWYYCIIYYFLHVAVVDELPLHKCHPAQQSVSNQAKNIRLINFQLRIGTFSLQEKKVGPQQCKSGTIIPNVKMCWSQCQYMKYAKTMLNIFWILRKKQQCCRYLVLVTAKYNGISKKKILFYCCQKLILGLNFGKISNFMCHSERYPC